LKPYYEESGITIYHGDCRDVLPQLEHVDLVLTDPPYGINLKPPRGLTDKIVGDNRSDAINLLSYFVDWCKVGIMENTAHFFFAGWSEYWVQECLNRTFKVKSCIVWRKNNFGIGYHTRPQHEFIYLVHKNDPPVPPNPKSDVWDFDKVNTPTHSCEKPIKLLEECILYYPSQQNLLDLFMGSGTILRAAKDLGRKAIGIEIEEKYCEIAAKRLQQEVFDFK